MNSRIFKIILPAILVSVSACSTSQNRPVANVTDEDMITSEQYAELKEKEAQVARLQEELKNAKGMSAAAGKVSTSGELLPPNAKPGECYARAWVPPTYRTLSKQMLVKDATENVAIIPAKYEWVEERVQVKEASSRLQTIPAAYAVEKETIKVADAARTWRTGLGNSAPPASDDLLASAKKYGIDLDSATPGMCYHEHFHPATYETIEQQVLVSEPSSRGQGQ